MSNPNNYAPNPYPPPVYSHHSYPPQPPKVGWGGLLSILGTSLFFYLIALCTPVFRIEGGGTEDSTWPGFAVLVMGWAGIIFMQFAWYAHLPLLIGIVLLLCRRWIGAIVCVTIAILLALDIFFLYSQEVPANEAATSYAKFSHIYIGFYFWLLSIVAIGIGAIILKYRERSLIQQSPIQPYPQHPQL